MNRNGLKFCVALAAVMLVLWGAGCNAPPIKPVLTDPDPTVKIPAMELAVVEKDRSAIPILIKNLESDDPAVRFYANRALRKLTGGDFGFLYYGDEELRRPAVQRWRDWFATSAGHDSTAPSQP
jgi:hypothetical protein